MTVIDVFSRRAYAEMIYRKKPEYTAESMMKVIKLWGKPTIIQTDDGNEYEGEYRILLSNENIKQKKNFGTESS